MTTSASHHENLSHRPAQRALRTARVARADALAATLDKLYKKTDRQRVERE